MKNYEKYKELVISCVLQDSICDLARVAYGNNVCDRITCKECGEFTAEWLNRECAEIDWAKVEVDTPVIVTRGNEKACRYFAGYRNGIIEVYIMGQTSWSSDGATQSWEPKYVNLYKLEDFIKYAK